MDFDARTVRIRGPMAMHVSASYIMLSKPYISIIELIKLVRVEYVLGRQRLNSFIFLFEEASACNAVSQSRAKQSRDPEVMRPWD